MRKIPLSRLAVALLASTAFCSPTIAAQPSGSAVRVDRLTNADGATGARMLETDGEVFAGDEIVTDPNGLAQIRFVDNTRIVIGPNSRLVIDSFVFNPDQTARRVAVTAAKGVFRFITGNSPHQAYSIRTPTMTIGVRGTVIDINARGADSSAVFSQGGGTICDQMNNCVDVLQTCQMWVVPNGGGGVTQATGVDRQTRIAAGYPFLGAGNNALNADFRVFSSCATVDGRVFQQPAEGFNQRSSSSTSPPPPFSPPPVTTSPPPPYSPPPYSPPPSGPPPSGPPPSGPPPSGPPPSGPSQ